MNIYIYISYHIIIYIFIMYSISYIYIYIYMSQYTILYNITLYIIVYYIFNNILWAVQVNVVHRVVSVFLISSSTRSACKSLRGTRARGSGTRLQACGEECWQEEKLLGEGGPKDPKCVFKRQRMRAQCVVAQQGKQRLQASQCILTHINIYIYIYTLVISISYIYIYTYIYSVPKV